MTLEQLAEIEARATAATRPTKAGRPVFEYFSAVRSNDAYDAAERAAQLIQTARDDIPALVAEVRRLRAEIESLRDMVEVDQWEQADIAVDRIQSEIEKARAEQLDEVRRLRAALEVIAGGCKSCSPGLEGGEATPEYRMGLAEAYECAAQIAREALG